MAEPQGSHEGTAAMENRNVLKGTLAFRIFSRGRAPFAAVLLGTTLASTIGVYPCWASTCVTEEQQDSMPISGVPDAVESMSLIAVNSATLRVTIAPTAGYTLYLNRLQFTAPNGGYAIGEHTVEPAVPAGSNTIDRPFSVLLTVSPLHRVQHTGILVSYQGCDSTKGVCLAPTKRLLWARGSQQR